MALSFKSVQIAYIIFNELKKEFIPDLRIDSFPQDMMGLSSRKDVINPDVKRVYGYDRKQDDGWERLVFFVKDPTEELKKAFEEKSIRVPNSSISHPYSYNEKLWIFGWF